MSKFTWIDYVNKESVNSDEPYTGCINNLIAEDAHRIATPSTYCVLCLHDSRVIVAVGPFVFREDAETWISLQEDPYINDYDIIELRDKTRIFYTSVQEFEDPREGM